MHPAYSIIFFTTASGIGYGMLGILGLYAWQGKLPPSSGFVLTALGVSLGLVTLGLLSSTFHLGHPERAWRAFREWRSSWLSREGIAAVATYVPALMFGAGWLAEAPGLVGASGALAAVGSVLTIVCTGMIYASLRAVPTWYCAWVPWVYLSFAVMSGGLWLLAFASVFGYELPSLDTMVVTTIAVTTGLKFAYWSRNLAPVVTRETATGLGTLAGQTARVSSLDFPHTETNYLQREMGYVIARKHAHKLRQHACLLAFALPLMLSILGLIFPVSGASSSLFLVAAIFATVGVAIERWLFFAEAKHTVAVYYHEDQV